MLKPDSTGTLGEVFDNKVLPRLELRKIDVDKRVDELKELFNTQLEIENNIKLAQEVLTYMKISEFHSVEEEASIKELIQKYKQQQQITQTNLKSNSGELRVNPDEQLIFTRFSEEMGEYLKTIESIREGGLLPGIHSENDATTPDGTTKSLPASESQPFQPPINVRQTQKKPVDRRNLEENG